MLTLWDLIEPVVNVFRGKPSANAAPTRAKPAMPRPDPSRTKRIQKVRSAQRSATAATVRPAPVEARPAAPANETAQERYDRVVNEMLVRYEIRVRRWRKGMCGVAWQIRYRDGRVVNMLESPKPKGPMSMAIFLHEVGHHAIGLGRYRPRCLEEYHAWKWSLEAMERHGIQVTDSVRHRVAESLWYAVSKAQRRGIRSLPDELLAYQTRLPRRRRSRDE